MFHTRVSSTARHALLALLLLLTGCGGQMADQPRLEPYESSSFFEGESGSREVVAGTVPRGFLQEDALLYTGREADDSAALEGSARYPFEITLEVLERGQERYNINCTPCHGRLGEGNGIIVRRGYAPPPSLHESRLRDSPPGHFFNVITNGWGQMPSYAGQVDPVDRWAIAAYIQTLQLSQNATLDEVPADQRSEVEALEQEEIPTWPGAPLSSEGNQAEGSEP